MAMDKNLDDQADHPSSCTWQTGTGGSAVSSILRQLTTSAEVEEVWELPCGALDLELDAVEDATREMHSTLRTKWHASCTLGSTSDRWHE